jgi:hypothetical protein
VRESETERKNERVVDNGAFIKNSHVKRFFHKKSKKQNKNPTKKFGILIPSYIFFYFRCKFFYMGNIYIEGGNNKPTFYMGNIYIEGGKNKPTPGPPTHPFRAIFDSVEYFCNLQIRPPYPLNNPSTHPKSILKKLCKFVIII